MNIPSLDKFVDAVVPGGMILVDSSLIDKKVERSDIKTIYIPATKIAEDNGFKGMANMIMVGKLFAEVNFCSEESLDKGILKSVPPKKEKLIDANRGAVKVGRES